MHRWKHHDPKALHSGRGKGGKEGKVVKSQDQAIAIALSMEKAGKSGYSERLESIGYSESVAAEVASMLDGTYDFTRCERPDGTAYGTGGKCRKGQEVSADEEKAISQLSGMLPKGEKIIDSSGKVRGKLTHETHANLTRGFSKKPFKDYVDKWGGKITGETDRGVNVGFPSESLARSFAKNLKFDTRIKGVDVSERDINPVNQNINVPGYSEFDWEEQFDTGKGPGKSKQEESGPSDRKHPGELVQEKDTRTKRGQSEMLSGVSLPKGPGNPQSGSSKEVSGMRMLG